MALGRMTAVCLLALLVSFVTVGYLGTPVEASLYFNSSEPGCNGSDSNVLWCDDFENGAFFYTYGDRNNSLNKGWSATVFPPSGWCQLTGGLCLNGNALLDAQHLARCGNLGAAGTSCAGYQGPRPAGSNQSPGMADHNLAQSVSEVYIRFYVRWLNTTTFTGNNKIQFTVNPFQADGGNSAGIFFGASFAGPAANNTAEYHFYAINQGTNYYQNQGNDLNVGADGHWYFIERHLKLNTPGQSDGVFEEWINDCGANGLGCSGTPTLRAQYNNVLYRADNSLIGNIWMENYSSGVADPTGADSYIDQIKASKVGPIGFMAAAGPVPSVPTRTSLSSIGVASIVVALLVFPAVARRRGRWLPHRAE